jgi:hypothetical protein
MATQNGLGALWIVIHGSPRSTLGDICFQASPHDFALRVRGGLDPEEIIGWFDDADDANRVAQQELDEVALRADKFVQPLEAIEIVERGNGPRFSLLSMEKMEIGDFIKIPAWGVEGCVIDIRPASSPGSVDALEVLLDSRPDDPHPRWYRVQPGEFEVTS